MKRFSETNKWKDEWFLELTPSQKLIYLFILDNCDNAGFFDINQRLNSFLLNMPKDDYISSLHELDRAYVVSEDRSRIWIKKFLYHQKNTPLNGENNAHKQIINLIKINQERFKYDFSACPYLGANKGLFSPIGKGKGKGKGKVKVDDRAESIYLEYPRKEAKQAALKAITKALAIIEFDLLMSAVKEYASALQGHPDKTKIPHPATWFNDNRWEDDRSMWPAWRVSGNRQEPELDLSGKEWDTL